MYKRKKWGSEALHFTSGRTLDVTFDVIPNGPHGTSLIAVSRLMSYRISTLGSLLAHTLAHRQVHSQPLQLPWQLSMACSVAAPPSARLSPTHPQPTLPPVNSWRPWRQLHSCLHVHEKEADDPHHHSGPVIAACTLPRDQHIPDKWHSYSSPS